MKGKNFKSILRTQKLILCCVKSTTPKWSTTSNLPKSKTQYKSFIPTFNISDTEKSNKSHVGTIMRFFWLRDLLITTKAIWNHSGKLKYSPWARMVLGRPSETPQHNFSKSLSLFLNSAGKESQEFTLTKRHLWPIMIRATFTSGESSNNVMIRYLWRTRLVRKSRLYRRETNIMHSWPNLRNVHQFLI